MLLALTILATYLIGAVPFGLIVSRLFGIKDIRSKGSGNIGAANVWRIAGFKAGFLVFAADIGKGALAVMMAAMIYDKIEFPYLSLELFLAVCGAAAVIGHVYPVFLKFKGGKGASTTLGVVAALFPVISLICFAVFLLVLLLTGYVSLGSIVGVFTLSLSLMIQKFVLNDTVSLVYLIMAAMMTVLVIYAHRQNISRMIAGSETRFSFASKLRNAK